MMTENDLLNRLKTIPNLYLQRIETAGTGSGVPDVHFCYQQDKSIMGVEGWLELKIGVPRVKPSQVAWHTRARAQGRRAFILTYFQSTSEYILYHPKTFRRLDANFFTPVEIPECKYTEKDFLVLYLVKDYKI